MVDFIASTLGVNSTVAAVIAAGVQCALLLNVVALGALVFIWMERKISGRIQDRLGPTRVGGRFGWLQTLADGIKLIAKEDLTPADADHMLFKLAPYLSFAASFTAFMALPFSDGWVAVHVNAGVFFILAVLGLEVFGTILAGYASGSKWSLFGAMREAAQVVSYEVPLGMCVVVPVLICGTMDLVTIANMQSSGAWAWLVFHDPFTFCVFWVYFTCAMASVNRAPFDLAEAESELVAGFHTEYSGLRWSFFFMAEYGSMFLVAGLATILFFGGWHGPIPIFADEMMWGLPGLGFTGQDNFLGFIAATAGAVNFVFKVVLGVTVMIWVRWTFPRLRIDQVMTMCLKYCVPLAAACFLGAVFVKANVFGLGMLSADTWLNKIGLSPNRAEFREGWVLELESELDGESADEDGDFDEEDSDEEDDRTASVDGRVDDSVDLSVDLSDELPVESERIALANLIVEKGEE